MDKKDKINLDFDFLEKTTPEVDTDNSVHQKKSKEMQGESRKVSGPMSDDVKKWLTGIAIVGAIIMFAASGEDSSQATPTSNSTATTSKSNDGLIQTGQYRCSQYHHNRAGELEPSTVDGATLDSKTSQLAAESDRMDLEKYQLENEYVNEYNQRSINQHNQSIDDYNSRLKSYRYKAQSHKAAIDSYNARVEAYNNYLVTNCTRSY